MQLKIQILDDAGTVVHEQTASAEHPTQWRTPPDKPLDAGRYLIFGYVYQSQVTLNPEWLARNRNR